MRQFREKLKKKNKQTNKQTNKQKKNKNLVGMIGFAFIIVRKLYVYYTVITPVFFYKILHESGT